MRKLLLGIVGSLTVVAAADIDVQSTIEQLQKNVQAAQGHVDQVYQATKEIHTCTQGYELAVKARAEAGANLREAKKLLKEATEVRGEGQAD